MNSVSEDIKDRSQTDYKIYCFGDIRFIPERQLLLHGSAPLRVGSRALDLLHLLVARAGELVTKDELRRFAWPSTFVHEGNLKVNIAALRRALPRAPSEPPYIATVPGRGYRFVAPLRVHTGFDESNGPASIKAQSGELPPILPIIGRDDVLAGLDAKLAACGFLTITGPAGVGKTTVAVAAAGRIAHRYPDGVCFVDLAVLDDPKRVVATVALSLGVDSKLTDMFAGLADTLRDRDTLLILDNCEHVLSATATVAEHLRMAVPRVHILATSREAMRSRFETVYRLPALDYPDADSPVDANSAMTFPALELFVRRAEATHGYAIRDADAPIIAAICRRLDGIALAIELAVPGLALRDPAALLDLLQQSFEPLNAGSGHAVPRHQTLLAMLDWSYRLLSEDEARLFRFLSVFAGPFALDDVVGVSRCLDMTREDLAACTDGLAAKSLLSMMYHSSGVRYRLLDSTRSFAAERLRNSGEDGAVLASYAQYLLDVFERAEDEWHWRAREDWTASYAARANDIRKAIDWAFGETGDPQLGVRLTSAAIPLWDELSTVGESRLRVERALQSGAGMAGCDPVVRMKLTASYASGLNFSDHFGPEADAAWKEAYRLARSLRNVDYQLRALWGLSVLQSFCGRHGQALATLERFDEIAEKHKERSATPDGERVRLLALFYCGDLRAAQEGLTALAQEHGAVTAHARVARFVVDRFVSIRVALALAIWVRGDHRQAMERVKEALDRATALGHLVSQSNALAQAALPLACHIGDLDLARQHAATLAYNLRLRKIAVWGPVCRFFEGAIASAGDDAGSVDVMHSAIDELIGNNFLVRVPMYLAMAAEAALKFGRTELARKSVSAAFDRAEQQTEHWCRPELLRVRGLLHCQGGDLLAAEQMFLQAAQTAKDSGAISFQLRAATGLAELLRQTGREAEAVARLKPVYLQFDPGFHSEDVRRAGEFLDALEGRKRPIPHSD